MLHTKCICAGGLQKVDLYSYRRTSTAETFNSLGFSKWQSKHTHGTIFFGESERPIGHPLLRSPILI